MLPKYVLFSKGLLRKHNVQKKKKEREKETTLVHVMQKYKKQKQQKWVPIPFF